MPLESDLAGRPGEWTFDAAVAEQFDEMLRRSIPQHDEMRRLCFEVGCRFVQDRTDVVDLGCSRGDALDPFVRRFGAFNRFVGVEVSEPMAAAARARFAGYIAAHVVDVRGDDLRLGYPPVRASLTLCVLTLQFVPIEHRLRLARDVYRHTIPGGALVLVEKVLGSTAEADAELVHHYQALKAANGYSADEIARKALALEGVLVPVTARWNEEILHGAGFRHVECFWRWLNFAGWLAVRDP